MEDNLRTEQKALPIMSTEKTTTSLLTYIRLLGVTEAPKMDGQVVPSELCAFKCGFVAQIPSTAQVTKEPPALVYPIEAR
jgi:hypothetical protein